MIKYESCGHSLQFWIGCVVCTQEQCLIRFEEVDELAVDYLWLLQCQVVATALDSDELGARYKVIDDPCILIGSIFVVGTL